MPWDSFRVFKKTSSNGKVTTYLGKRDFLDHIDHIDPIDGILVVDPSDISGDEKVYVQVLAAFRYGREDLDVLGMAFKKDLFVATKQVYPPTKEETVVLSKMQDRLMRKLGPHAYAFVFNLPHETPSSVTLQSGPEEDEKPCGVDYELKSFIANGPEEKPKKKSIVNLVIRKLTYAPEEPGPQPTVELLKEFVMSPGPLRLEASLDNEKYYHGESIAVHVFLDNNTRKTIKKMKLSVVQEAEIMLFTSARYSCSVDEKEIDDGFPVHPGTTGWCKVFHLCPLLSSNRDKRGLALDGKLKHQDTNLASSTIIKDPRYKEIMGIIVQYKVRVRLILGFGVSDVIAELPFTLTHPIPHDETIAAMNDVHRPRDEKSAAEAAVVVENFSRMKLEDYEGHSGDEEDNDK